MSPTKRASDPTGRQKKKIDLDPKKESILRQLYLDPLEPTAYGSAKHLLEAAKKHNPSTTPQDVRKFLRGLTFYTRLFPPNYTFERRPIVAFGRGWHQIDLASMLGTKRFNKSHAYFLLVLDTLSGMLYAEPVKRKTAVATADAYRNILARCPYTVRFAQSDEGREFGGPFRALLKSRNIRYYSTANKATKAAGVERAIRTVKRRLYMYMLKKKMFKWIDALPKIIDALNNTVSSVTKMKPSQVGKENEEEVFLRRYHSGKHPPQSKYSFQRGDLVRCQTQTDHFRRSFYPAYSPIVYQVSQAFPTRPHIYEVKDNQTGRHLLRRFYSKEMVAVENEEADFTTPPKRRIPLR